MWLAFCLSVFKFHLKTIADGNAIATAKIPTFDRAYVPLISSSFRFFFGSQFSDAFIYYTCEFSQTERESATRSERGRESESKNGHQFVKRTTAAPKIHLNICIFDGIVIARICINALEKCTHDRGNANAWRTMRTKQRFNQKRWTKEINDDVTAQHSLMKISRPKLPTQNFFCMPFRWLLLLVFFSLRFVVRRGKRQYTFWYTNKEEWLKKDIKT